MRVGRLHCRCGCLFTIFRVTFSDSSVYIIIATDTIGVIVCRFFLLFITDSMNSGCASRCCGICGLTRGAPVVAVGSVPVVNLRTLRTLLLSIDHARTNSRSSIARTIVISLELVEASGSALC